MTVRISKLYGMDIYTADAGYIGKVSDIILNLEHGEIIRVTTEPLRTISREDTTKILKEKSILYKKVTSVGDIMIVGRGAEPEIVEEPVKLEKKPSSGLRPTARQLLKK